MGPGWVMEDDEGDYSGSNVRYPVAVYTPDDDYRQEERFYSDDYSDSTDDSFYRHRRRRGPLHCSLCDVFLRNTRVLLAHILSEKHNLLLDMVEHTTAKRSMALLNSSTSTKRKLLDARVTKRLKMIKPPPGRRPPLEGVEEKKLAEIIVDDEEDDQDQEEEDSNEKPLPIKAKETQSNALVPVPSNKSDLRNRLNDLKEKQAEEKKAEKRKKKNIRTREAKKRNKKNAKEEKKRIDQALEALEEEDEDVAYIKKTMGFSKFQTTKIGYF